MIKLIRNEFIKIKKSKLIFTQILFLITIIIVKKYSSKSLFDLSFNLIPFISIMISILFGGIISKEIENGNFRYYLTKPYKRWKIYLSKLITIIIYASITILLIILFSCILEKSIDKTYIFSFIKYSFPVYFMCFYVLYLSTIFKSHSLSVGLSIFTISFSLIISQVLFGIEFNIIEYTFLPYLDFSIFKDYSSLMNINSELGINLNIKSGVIIDSIFMLLFYLLGNRKFIKKDIKY